MKTSNKSTFIKITIMLVIVCMMSSNIPVKADINTNARIQNKGSVTGSAIAPSASPLPVTDTLSNIGIKVKSPSLNYVATGKTVKLTAVLYNKDSDKEEEISKEDYNNYKFSWYYKQNKKTSLLKPQKNTCNIKIENTGINSYYCIAEIKEDIETEDTETKDIEDIKTKGIKTKSTETEDSETEDSETKDTKTILKSNTVKVTGYKSNVNIIYKKSIAIADIFGLSNKKTAKAKLNPTNKDAKNNTSLGNGKITSTGYCKNAKISVQLSGMKTPVTITVNTELPTPKLILRLLKDKKTLVGYCENASGASSIELRFRRPNEKKYVYMSVIGDKFKHATSKKKQGKYVNLTKLKVKEYKARAVYKINGKTIKTGWSETRV